MILGAGDVRQDGEIITALDQSHGDAGNGRLDRHAAVHHGQGSPADRCHGRRAVRLQDVRDHPERVGEALLGRNHRPDGPLGKGAVPDLPPARPAHEADLAHRERREVIVQHELLLRLALDVVEALGIGGRAQGGRDQRLGFAPGEERRSVCAGKNAHLAVDRADLVEAAAVEAPLLVANGVGEDLGLQLLEDPSGQAPFLVFVLAEGRHEVLLDGGHPFVRGDLVPEAHGIGESRMHLVAHHVGEIGGNIGLLHGPFHWPDLIMHLLDDRADPADVLVTDIDGLEDLLFRDLMRSRLDHCHSLGRPGHQQVELRLLELLERRIDLELPVEETDADACQRCRERDLAAVQRGTRPTDRQDVAVVLLVR